MRRPRNAQRLRESGASFALDPHVVRARLGGPASDDAPRFEGSRLGNAPPATGEHGERTGHDHLCRAARWERAQPPELGLAGVRTASQPPTRRVSSICRGSHAGAVGPDCLGRGCKPEKAGTVG